MSNPILPVRCLQRLVNPLSLHFGGDRLLRDTFGHREALGFAIDQVASVVERVLARTLAANTVITPDRAMR